MSLDFEITVDIDAGLPDVWNALTETSRIRHWWDDGVSLEARPGGRFEERWKDADGRTIVTRGRVEHIEPQAAMVLSWADEDWSVQTRVRFRLELSGSGTRLTLRHSGWEQFGQAEGRRLAKAHREGWNRHLEALRSFAAGKT